MSRDTVNKLSNLFVKPLLRSPLHFLVSGQFMLITFTGRKSGKTYSTPVQYQQQGEVITFFTNKYRVWWKNLKGGAPVTLRLKGREVRAVAEPCEQDDAITQQQLQVAYPRMPVAQAAEIAAQSIVVQVRLQ